MSSRFRMVLMNYREFDKWIHKVGPIMMETVVGGYLNGEMPRMVEEMQAQLGSYQASRGPYAAWAQLQVATISSKATGDSPLLETEAMKSSIQWFDFAPLKKFIGATDPKASRHEYGAPLANVPARAFVRPIIWINAPILKKGIRKALVRAWKNRGS